MALRVCKGYPGEGGERLYSKECAGAAHTKEDLEKFVQRKKGKPGRNNLCLNCRQEHDHKRHKAATEKRKAKYAKWLKENPQPLRVCKGYPWEGERCYSANCAKEAWTTKELERFRKGKHSEYGRYNMCKNCMAERAVKRRYKKAEPRRTARIAWLKKNPQPLRRCKGYLCEGKRYHSKDCAKEAWTEEELEKFVLRSNRFSGHKHQCKNCANEYMSKRTKRLRRTHAYRERQKAIDRKWRQENPFKETLYSIKARAKQRELDFDLDLEHLNSLWKQSGGICAATGDKMLLNDGNGRTAYSMSVDRINSKKGYIKGNVRFICDWYNTAKWERSDSETLELFQRAINHANFTPLPLHARP